MADNTVTFQPIPVQTHSMKCLPVLVELDGLPAPWLELQEIVRQPSPKFNQARFRLTSGIFEASGRFENVTSMVRPGQRVKVFLVCSSDPATGNQLSWPLFGGVICQSNAALAGNGETVEIIAHDELAYHDRTAIDGIRDRNPADQAIYVRCGEVVFNPDGDPNRSTAVTEINGRSYHTFESNLAAAHYWSYAGAIRYIACEYLGSAVTENLSLESLESLTRGQVMRDVDVTGLSPLAAIHRLCRRAGLQFCIVHAPGKDGQVYDTLYFYRRGQGREIFLRHQKNGHPFDWSETNIAQCTIEATRPYETTRVIGRGDTRRLEATFELVKGWDPALEENNYALYSPATNDNFLKVRDVFRKWVLNEAGDYSSTPYNQGPAYDFSGVLGTDSYRRQRRRFRPCLSRSLAGKSLGYYLEVSYNDGAGWQLYAGAFDNLLDQCGVYLSSNQLDSDVWNAIKKGKLQFRMTATVAADEHLEAILADGPVDAVRPVRTVIVNLGHEFKYRQVTANSIFHNVATDQLGKPDEADDTESLRGQLRDRLEQMRQTPLTGKVRLAWLRPDIWPGDVTKGISGRDVNFGNVAGRREYVGQIEQVKMILGQEWSTNVTFGGS